MRGLKKRITGGMLALVMSSALVLNVNAVTLDEAQKKADELEQQKEAAESEKKSLVEQLDGIIASMKETQEKLTAKEDEIATAENELIQAKVNENDQYESMKMRIKFMYEGGNAQFFEILLESKSITDFLNKAEYVSQLSAYDRDMLEEFQAVVEDVEEKEASLQAEYTELNTLQDELTGKQTEVQTLLDSKEAQIEDLEAQIGENAETIQELQRQAEEAERLRKEQAESASGGSSYRPGSGGNVVSGNGYFTHPCPGMTYQSSYFGEIRPFEKGGHKGHDYAAPTGTPTYAAAAGTVIRAGWSNSAGNWVVINHGNGLVTKYMHHSAICVATGQYVEKGQQIGYVGSTGQSTGPHLHFQVELNGVAVNPDNYL
ncbi:MAG TPA: peptidoglycan DD-metalloendopeptidase family protein [Candidatus Mediterraneibacter faecigallinarum]|uniref:Peptidoglycan DD-metalloendopeptidase family protein n=1 Tax=Candidatus Mediterraneibacter faecigallinarum TaxID=2838669 RepID=A0A9D2SXG9_9FIRM|nr:peptidoglycan DD-metalloendopeptidase family protein [Candidatus Mediterraneibacter faecigallinarum]